MTESIIKKCPTNMDDLVRWDTVYAPVTQNIYGALLDNEPRFTIGCEAKEVLKMPDEEIYPELKSAFCLKEDKYYYESDKLSDMQSALLNAFLEKVSEASSKIVHPINDKYLDQLFPTGPLNIEGFEPKKASLSEIDGDFVVLDGSLDRKLVKQIMAAVNDKEGEIFIEIANNVFAVARDAERLREVLNLLNTVTAQMLENKDAISAGKLEELIDKIDKVFYEKTQEVKEFRSDIMTVLLFGSGTAMDLKEFIFDVRWICKVIPEISRAPPKITFDRNVAEDGFAYAQPECAPATDDADFNQTVPENDGFFNQDLN